MLKFLTDKHVSKAIVEQLQNRDIDVLRVEDIDMGAAKDFEILSYAAAENRAVITFDSDFQDLHQNWLQQNKTHAGIFFCSYRLQGQSGIGKIVTTYAEFHELILADAGTLEDDIYRHLYFIR